MTDSLKMTIAICWFVLLATKSLRAVPPNSIEDAPETAVGVKEPRSTSPDGLKLPEAVLEAFAAVEKEKVDSLKTSSG